MLSWICDNQLHCEFHDDWSREHWCDFFQLGQRRSTVVLMTSCRHASDIFCCTTTWCTTRKRKRRQLSQKS